MNIDKVRSRNEFIVAYFFSRGLPASVIGRFVASCILATATSAAADQSDGRHASQLER
jgi:hypothetical protein